MSDPTLRLVQPRTMRKYTTSPPDLPESPTSSDGPFPTSKNCKPTSPRSLGDKLQQLAHIDPAALTVIERFADSFLNEALHAAPGETETVSHGGW